MLPSTREYCMTLPRKPDVNTPLSCSKVALSTLLFPALLAQEVHSHHTFPPKHILLVITFFHNQPSIWCWTCALQTKASLVCWLQLIFSWDCRTKFELKFGMLKRIKTHRTLVGNAEQKNKQVWSLNRNSEKNEAKFELKFGMLKKKSARLKLNWECWKERSKFDL